MKDTKNSLPYQVTKLNAFQPESRKTRQSFIESSEMEFRHGKSVGRDNICKLNLWI